MAPGGGAGPRPAPCIAPLPEGEPGDDILALYLWEGHSKEPWASIPFEAAADAALCFTLCALTPRGS